MPRRRSPRFHLQIHACEEGTGMARRRSSRLHRQTQASEQSTGMAPRRSPRLHPQIQANEDGAGVICRRSTRLHPQIQMNEDGAGVTRRRRRGRATSPASLPDHDDMLWEILLRLPPQPSSLPRASAVCKRWRGLVTDPGFLRAFRAHHRKPPLLGTLELRGHKVEFTPVLDPPDRIPPHRFDLSSRCSALLDCRHGLVLVLIKNTMLRQEIAVCDPITGEHRSVAIPADLTNYDFVSGAVLCAASQLGHVHGSCHSRPFKVVLLFLNAGRYRHEDGYSYYDYEDDIHPTACVYSSETGVWGNVISTTDPCFLGDSNPGTLIGNILYWSSKSASPEVDPFELHDPTNEIVELDLARQSLAVSYGPRYLDYSRIHHIIQAEDGGVGLAIFSHGRLEMWQRVHYHGCPIWSLQKTIEIHTFPGLPPLKVGYLRHLKILGYDEDNGAVFVYVDANVYMVQPSSRRSRKLYERRYESNCLPFTSFYAQGGG